jgi:superfamily II DNA/RNA helicase
MGSLELASDGRFLSSLSRLRARVSLGELLGTERSEEVDSINWQVDPWAIGKASIALHHEIQQASLHRSKQLDEETRRAALVDARGWESLAGLENAASSFGSFINSAVGYELAGYQANAVCVARAAERRLGARPSPSFALAASAFVQRQFLRIGPYAAALSRPPDVSSFLPSTSAASDQPATTLQQLLTDDDVAQLMAHSIGAQGLQRAAQYFLSGTDSHLTAASELLQIAAQGFVASGSVRDANLVWNLLALLPEMRRRATWTVLAEYFPDNPRWTRYLRVLARGLGQMPRTSTSISELWPSQLSAINGGILSSHESKVVRMPTSAGKTRVAELAIVHALLTRSDRTCLYIAPFRALAEEIEESLDRVLGEIGLGASSLVGGPETIGIEEVLAAESPVLVLTPEKADLLLRVRPDLLDLVGLVVLDEGHIVGDERRGPAFELLISRLRRRLEDARFLFLSAVVPDETLTDFASWLGASGETGILQSGWRPAIQRIASFEWTAGGGTLRYQHSSAGSDEVQAFERFLPRLIPDRPFTFTNPRTGRSNTRKFPDPTNRGHLIAGLAFEFVNTGSVLMFCPQTNLAETCAKALQTRIELAELVDEPVPQCFNRRRYPSADVAATWLGEDDDITRLLRTGVGVHHGRLPDAVRRAIEDDFRAGRLQALAATTTLGQGVNLPVRTVLVHSVRRRDDEGNETRLTGRDYWNIAGRAGRAGFETDGLVVHLVLNSRDRQDFQFFLARADDIEPVYSSLFRMLSNLVNNRISSADALAELDPSLMALLVEEGADNVNATVADIDDLLRHSLVGVQADRYSAPIDTLVDVATSGASAIAANYPFDDLAVFSRTGLSSSSCQHLKIHAYQNRTALVNAFAATHVTHDLVALLLDGLSGVPEVHPERPFTGNYDELVMEWISGVSVPQISKNLAPPDQDPFDVAALARVIEEMSTYLFPWGFSAYLQIAEHTLGIEPPARIAALPGLVKYGLPDEVAAWLMGFGVATRSLAIGIATEYAKAGLEIDPAAVRTWLARQDAVGLAEAVGATAEALEEIASVLERTRRPQLSTDLQAGPLLPRDAYVLIDVDPQATITAASVGVGDSLAVFRDYESSIDRNSIRVSSAAGEFGQLDPASSSVLAIEVDAGLDLSATVTVVDHAAGTLTLSLDKAN